MPRVWQRSPTSMTHTDWLTSRGFSSGLGRGVQPRQRCGRRFTLITGSLKAIWADIWRISTGISVPTCASGSEVVSTEDPNQESTGRAQALILRGTAAKSCPDAKCSGHHCTVSLPFLPMLSWRRPDSKAAPLLYLRKAASPRFRPEQARGADLAVRFAQLPGLGAVC